MRTIIASVVILMLVTLLDPLSATACSCEFPGPPLIELQNNAAVFTGKVVSISLDSASLELRVEVEVYGYWKGVVSSPVTIYTDISGAACGYAFSVDSSYLIYAVLYGDVLYTSICSRTADLSHAGYDLGELGPPMVLGVGDGSVVPTNYFLSQNYPNPFNPVTTIRFDVPVSGIVSVKVFNLLGEEVATLVSEELHPGTHTRQWNAEKFASGVYYYRLQTRDFVDTKKLLLLK